MTVLKTKSSIPALMLLVVLLSGTSCTQRTAMGRDFDTSHIEDIERGVTTKNQIREWFGPPIASSHSSMGETWSYNYRGEMVQRNIYSAVLSGNRMVTNEDTESTKTLTVIFEDDVVKDFTYTSMGE